MTAVYVAWLLLAGWLFTYAARVLIADLRESRGRCEQSWCGCAVDCRKPVADA